MVRNLFDQLQIRKKAEQEINNHAQKALQSLKDLLLPEMQKTQLFEFADMLLVRKNYY